jgi:hypothetical protein
MKQASKRKRGEDGGRKTAPHKKVQPTSKSEEKAKGTSAQEQEKNGALSTEEQKQQRCFQHQPKPKV